MFVEAPWLSWLKRLSSSNWGLNKDHRRQLYKTVAERMILHGSVEWAASLSARQKRVLNSIQRNFLLNISRAYFTNPSAALQVIEGSLPLHLKAELEAAYVRLKQQISLDGRGFPPADYEEKPATTRLHPAAFQLEDRISFTKTVSQEEETNIYTDGSHLNNQTGCAFCVIKNEEITSDWMGKLRNENSVFQAELTAIKEACHWAINQDLQIKIWSDSESSLHSIQAINTKSAIAQEIQEVLLNSTNIRLGSTSATSSLSSPVPISRLSSFPTTYYNNPAAPPIFVIGNRTASTPNQQSSLRQHHPPDTSIIAPTVSLMALPFQRPDSSYNSLLRERPLILLRGRNCNPAMLQMYTLLSPFSFFLVHVHSSPERPRNL
ncbi:hypothetical protein HNY73_021900 [Argiope bruennichi]|uniref:RNase H type-1 domain-containing protein n=1 Tax=Argiope bruennichi TaxID=94029 RepID=A0A8T0E0V5_ARGBR|nr:hypothetical protein HNY73_021900 [Argiope bruennichi]